MSVEYIPFDPTLIGKEEIIIWCPRNEDYDGLAVTLESYGVMWASGDYPTELRLWDDRYDARCIDTDRVMTRAPHRHCEDNSDFERCIFMKWPPEQEVTVDVGDLI